MSKAPITTHILNLETGKPAAHVRVSLHNASGGFAIASAVTDDDGRIFQWDETFELQDDIYHLKFAVGDWYAQQGRSSFYPEVKISFQVDKSQAHYHIPLLLNAYGYSTYRGS
jgi:5-hydroxyisourate hydrolase